MMREKILILMLSVALVYYAAFFVPLHQALLKAEFVSRSLVHEWAEQYVNSQARKGCHVAVLQSDE